MSFHRVEPVPNLSLAHLVSTTRTTYWDRTDTTRTYAVRPLRLRRPAEGRSRQPVICPQCGVAVEVVVPSAALTRRRQRFWLAPTAVLLGLVLLGIVYSVLWFPWRENPLAFVLPFAGMFFALVGGLVCLLQARLAHGVSLARQPSRRGHSLRYPSRRRQQGPVRRRP